jgi:hypothetical protein
MDRPLTIFFLSELSVAEQDPSSNRIQAFQARTCALNVLTEPYPHLKEKKTKGAILSSPVAQKRTCQAHWLSNLIVCFSARALIANVTSVEQRNTKNGTISTKEREMKGIKKGEVGNSQVHDQS